ncbi:MAG: sulfite exporter TauE/SafE family protein [Burkholderiales bacterium]
MPGFEVLVFAPLIVGAAYVIFGMVGFGSVLIATPLLAHLFPIKFVLPLIVILDCIGSFGMGTRLRASVNRRELVPLLPFMLAGMVAGIFLLVRLPAGALLACLGVFALVYGAIYALKRDAALRLARWSAAPLGLVAGTSSTVLGVGGPIYVMYLAGRGSTPDQIRATMPVIFMFTTITRIALYATAGLFSRDVLLTAAALLPVMALGIYLGHRLQLRLPRDTVVRVIGVLVMASGVSLLLRAWSQAGT